MDKIAEKIGLYDLWAVFFPGTIGILGIYFGYHVYYMKASISAILFGLDFPDTIFVWIILAFLAVIWGIILQESGYYLKKIFHLKNATEGLLNEKYKIFSIKEIKNLSDFYNNYWSQYEEAESKNLFLRINSAAQDMGIAPKYVKLNVIQNMSLSLAVIMALESFGFLTEAFFFLIHCEIIPAFRTMVLCFAFFILICVFLRRYERYNRYWVRNIVYAVYNKENADRIHNGLENSYEESSKENES